MASKGGSTPNRVQQFLLLMSLWARWAITEMELRAFGETAPDDPAGSVGRVLGWYHAKDASLRVADSTIGQLARANSELRRQLELVDGARRDAVERYLVHEDQSRALGATLAETQQECRAWESSAYQLDEALTGAQRDLELLQLRLATLEAAVSDAGVSGRHIGIDQQREVAMREGAAGRQGGSRSVPG